MRKYALPAKLGAADLIKQIKNSFFILLVN